MDVMMRRRELMMSGGGLPGAYRRVEYLESSGTQYIKTNFVPSSDDISVDWDYMQTKNIPGDQMMFGVRNGNGGSVYAELYANNRWYAHALKAAYSNVSGGGSGNYGQVNNIKYHSSMTQASFDINGYSFLPSTIYNKSASKKLYIFAWNSATDTADHLANGLRLYNLTIRENGKLAANFIPCVRKSDNKPGMYDTVSHTFYTNAGTGEFIVPPPDTSPKIIATGKRWYRGSLTDTNDVSATVIYNYPSSGAVQTVSYDKLYYDMNIFRDGTYIDYWSSGNYKLTANSNGVAVNVITTYIDDSYLYIVETGQIIFAGRNTPYYGYTNINDMPST